MPTMLGSKTKAIFLNSESQKLSLEFEAIGNIGVLTFSADLVASDSVAGSVNGQDIDVTYGTSHTATMNAIANALAALSGVASAVVHGATSRVISFLLADATAEVVMSGFAVTNGGAGTASVTTSVVEPVINPGTPMILIGQGEKVAPANLYDHFGLPNATINLIGIAMFGREKGELVTLIMKGFAVIYGQASSTVAVGPVDLSGHDADTGYDKFVTGTTNGSLGFALDAGDDGDVIRILLCK